MKPVDALIQSQGKFVGIKTTQGRSYCAKLKSHTDKYIQVYDVNAGNTQKIAKSSISSVTTGGKTIQ